LVNTAFRAVEGSEEKKNKEEVMTLVPNFRSISPSIFNINLKQSARQANENAQAPGSPIQGSNNANHIYV